MTCARSRRCRVERRRAVACRDERTPLPRRRGGPTTPRRPVHLKSLTVKGFKSFASATTLRLEPGITCVVGPNGSGKSNVVDAIAWVLGEQGAKALRGGKMEDVIFAGTAGRAPLGRAEVTLTIDNTDGALPIDYTEVSITRRMFRSGESEYEINGDSCRLLDIQELLSDSGIGREMHVIVGQGQLDAVLHAKPEDRRAFIEEAAGVLKHRKRKEKALRKLESMQANLNRLTDLTAELRRQLKPLGKQAEVARRAAEHPGRPARREDPAARRRPGHAARDRSTARSPTRPRCGSGARRSRPSYEQVQERLAELEAALAEDAPVLAQAQETFLQLSTLQERLRATHQLATERLPQPDAPRSRRSGPAATPTSSPPRRRSCASRSASCAPRSPRTRPGSTRRSRAASRWSAASPRRSGPWSPRSRRSPTGGRGWPSWSARSTPMRTRSTAAADEIARLDAVARRGPGAGVRGRAGGVRGGRAPARPRPTAAPPSSTSGTPRPSPRPRRSPRRLKELSDAERAAEKDAAQWKAREEALALGPAPQGRRRRAARPGRPGARAARQRRRAADGASRATRRRSRRRSASLADAVAVSDVDGAQAAIELLKADDAGRAALLIGGLGHAGQGRPAGAARGRRAGRSTWSARPTTCAPAVVRLLARRGLRARPGDRAHDRLVRAGAAHGHARGRPARRLRGGRRLGQAPSFIEVQAAVEEARQNRVDGRGPGRPSCATSSSACAAQQTRGQGAGRRGRRRPQGGRGPAQRRRPPPGRARRRRALGARPRPTASRRAGSRPSRPATATWPGSTDLEERLRNAEATPIDTDPSTVERDELAAAVPAARQHEIEVRLAVRTAEERVGALVRPGRRAGPAGRRRAGGARAGRGPPGRPGPRRRRSPRPSSAGAEIALAQAARALDPGRRAPRRGRRRPGPAGRPSWPRSGRRPSSSAAELERLTSKVHRDEVARAEQRMRIEQLEAGRPRSSAWTPRRCIGEYGPQLPVPPTAPEIARGRGRGPAGARAGAVRPDRPRRSGPPRPSGS